MRQQRWLRKKSLRWAFAQLHWKWEEKEKAEQTLQETKLSLQSADEDIINFLNELDNPRN